MNKLYEIAGLGLTLLIVIIGCNEPDEITRPTGSNLKDTIPDAVIGCTSQDYPEMASSPYVLPFESGRSFTTGLCNCSSSYHAEGQPDQFAFDFNMPEGTPFIAARGGTVDWVVEGESSGGGGVGNYLVIKHDDNTYGLYYHSPKDGIHVAVGEAVNQGDVLGITGRSGLAGYPHLHFIVVSDSPSYPYDGVAISFRNAFPAERILQSNSEYHAGS